MKIKIEQSNGYIEAPVVPAYHKNYAEHFADSLCPSQKNHLRVLLSSSPKLEQLRRALKLPARRKLAMAVPLERRGWPERRVRLNGADS